MEERELKIEYVDIDSIKPSGRNAKQHPTEQIEQIKKSIIDYGMNDPIGVWHGEIVEGHGRHIALKELGKKKVPIIRLDELTDEQRREYMLVHNKTTMNSDFDVDILNIELEDLTDFDAEFYDFELPFGDDSSDEIVEDEIPEKVETRCKLGDLWQLGNHRLICGDSTDVAIIDRLMDGVKADISITSPPYNADHMDVPKSKERGGGTQKSTQKKYLADNDKRTDDEYFEFLCANIDVLLTASQEVFYNIGVGSGSKVAIARILNHYQNQWKEMMYWVKDNPMPVITESVISSATELIICFGENGSRSFKYFNDRLFHGVINGHSAALSNEYADIHKATFPIYLPSEIIKRFTPSNGTVLDSFGGTGTTLIACEQLNRKCYMAELDPHYCDVILERWENFTGSKAVLLQGE